MSDYPEHEKMKAVREESQTIGEFLDSTLYTLCEWIEAGDNGESRYVWLDEGREGEPNQHDFLVGGRKPTTPSSRGPQATGLSAAGSSRSSPSTSISTSTRSRRRSARCLTSYAPLDKHTSCALVSEQNEARRVCRATKSQRGSEHGYRRNGEGHA